MKAQERIKQLKRDFARNALYGTSWFINKLPFKFVKMMVHAFVAVAFKFTINQKRIARESLIIALGKEKSAEEREKIIRACFENLGRGMIELMYFMEHPSMIKEHVTIQGKEHLDQAFKEGLGIIAVSAHFGNFPLMLLHFAQAGIKTNAIIRPARDQEIEKYFVAQRGRLGLKTIYSHPRRECVERSIKVLRSNELLFIPLDQNFGSKAGVFVDFFGQKAATATGPIVFAMRTKSPIIPIFTVRDGEDRHIIIVEKPMKIEEGRDDKETVLINTQKITQIIETYIRKYPEEWGWMHRRWKSRPTGQDSIEGTEETSALV